MYVDQKKKLMSRGKNKNMFLFCCCCCFHTDTVPSSWFWFHSEPWCSLKTPARRSARNPRSFCFPSSFSPSAPVFLSSVRTILLNQVPFLFGVNASAGPKSRTGSELCRCESKALHLTVTLFQTKVNQTL